MDILPFLYVVTHAHTVKVGVRVAFNLGGSMAYLGNLFCN